MEDKLIELKNKIQSEYNMFVEMDSSCDLTEEELSENFWSEAIINYNDNNEDNEVGFYIENGIVKIVKYN